MIGRSKIHFASTEDGLCPAYILWNRLWHPLFFQAAGYKIGEFQHLPNDHTVSHVQRIDKSETLITRSTGKSGFLTVFFLRTSGRPFSWAADTQRNLGKPANGQATAAAPRKALRNTVDIAREFPVPLERCSIQLFSAHPRKLRLCQGPQHLASSSQSNQKWLFCPCVLSTHEQNGGGAEPCCNMWWTIPTCPFLFLKNLPTAQQAFLNIPSTPSSYVESLRHPLGQKVSCRIIRIQQLPMLHKESSASTCTGGLGPGLSWGFSYSHIGLSCTWIPCHVCILFQRVQG